MKKLTRYLSVMCVVLVGCTAVNLGARSLGQSRAAARNPFFAYVDVLPGQPKSVAIARSFVCPAQIYDTQDEHCDFRPKSGVFSHVAVDIVDGTISYGSFTVRNKTLRVGDLVLLWGMPDIEEHGFVVVLRWHHIDTIAMATSSAGKFSLMLGVNRVFISA